MKTYSREKPSLSSLNSGYLPLLVAIWSLISLPSCGILVQGSVAETHHAGLVTAVVDRTGATVAAVAASEGGTINLASSTNEAIRKVSVKIAPGALAFDTQIVVRQTTNIVNEETVKDLGLTSTTLAGPSVAVEASDMAALAGTIAVSLPYDPGLALNGVEFFVIGMYSEAGQSQVETFVGSELRPDAAAGVIELDISRFGAYQVAKSDGPVEKKTAKTEVTYMDMYTAELTGAADNAAFMIANEGNLPDCDASRLSHLYYVIDSNKFFSCNGTVWSSVDVTGPAGAQGPAGPTGAQGPAGEAGSGSSGPKLVNSSSGEEFGLLKGFGTHLWVEFEDGFHTLIDQPSTGTYKVRRGEIFYENRNCGGKQYVEHDGLMSHQRLTYTSAGTEPFAPIVGEFRDFSPQSIRRPGVPACHNVLSGQFLSHQTFDDIAYMSGNVVNGQHLLQVGTTGRWVGRSTDHPGGQSGTELFVTDGTEDGTDIIIIDSGNASNPEHFAAAGNYVYFAANHSSYGVELWKTDGVTATLVKDIKPGGTSAGISFLAASNVSGVCAGGVVFRADDGTGSKLWCSDGTSSGTVALSPFTTASGYNPAHMVEFQGAIYFAANPYSDGTEVYRFDGTYQGATLVADIYPGVSGSSPTSLSVAGSYLYFSADDSTNGKELHYWDGATVTKVPLPSGHSDPADFIAMGAGSKVAFLATTGSPDWYDRLFVYEAGGSAPADILQESTGGVAAHTVVNGRIFYAYESSPQKIWTSNGTGASTQFFLETHDFDHHSGGFLVEFMSPKGNDGFFVSDTGEGGGCDGPCLWGGSGPAVWTIHLGDTSQDEDLKTIPRDFAEVEVLSNYPRSVPENATFVIGP